MVAAKTKQRRKKLARWDRKAISAPLARQFSGFVGRARSPRLRSMLEFAQQEIVIPDGPFKGRRFSADRQPFNRLWFDAVDSGIWTTFYATGPSQSSKTLTCYIIPTLYHLFEVGETVIAAVPSMEMAKDKWLKDLLPAIESSRYRDQLPESGGGSRGGTSESHHFRNGATLRFMSGGGSDKRRAAYTARVVVITETDDFDKSSEGSHEADKITQIFARTRAYGDRARHYLECTVTIEEGRTWRGYSTGTKSEIVLPCPLCGVWVSPGRDQCRGWEDAETQMDARDATRFYCPSCGEAWTEPQRMAANTRCRLLHRGQEIASSGDISGPLPRTKTLGFRWSAVNNTFQQSSDIGADLWDASRDPDEDNAERHVCQFIFAVPYQPPKYESMPLDPNALQRRVSRTPRGMVPEWADYMTAFMDLGKYLNYWMVIAWSSEGRGHVVDYDVLEVATDQLGLEQATMVGLREFRDRVCAGWTHEDGVMMPSWAWYDAGWGDVTPVCYAFQRETAGMTLPVSFLPAFGRGATQQFRTQRYKTPSRKTSSVIHIGDGLHVIKNNSEHIEAVEVNSDHWKSWIHQRLICPVDTTASLLFFNALPREHLKLSKHLTAERQIEEFVAPKGPTVRWERIRRANHWLDCAYNCAAAAWMCGVRIVEDEANEPVAIDEAIHESPAFTTPDGQPYLVTER